MLENIGANMVYSLATNSIGIYFENADMFQTYSEPPTDTNAHPPTLNNAEVNRDCESEGDPFTFSVVYKDEDGDEAKDAYIRIVGFDGTERIYDTQDDIKLGKMIKRDGEPATGVLYTTTRLPEAPEYYYMFYFSDVKGKKVYLPLEGFSSPELGYAVPAAEIPCGEAAIVSDDVEVFFLDPNLEDAITSAINKPEGAIYAADLEGLTSLGASGKNIKDIAGLQYCNDLQQLELETNLITDVSPLKDLMNLQWLYLKNNRITDLSSLSGLTHQMEKDW